MPRQRGGRGANAADKSNANGKRAAPYETRRKGANNANAKNANANTAKNANNAKSKGKGGGGRGRGGGRGGGRGDKPKPKTAEELDREMDSYWGKSEEHAQKKLDSDMDEYWKSKDAAKSDEGAGAVVEDKTGEAAPAETTEDKAE